MNKIVLIVLTLLSIAVGIAIEFLLPEYFELSGWIIPLALLCLLFFAALSIRQKSLRSDYLRLIQRSNQLELGVKELTKNLSLIQEKISNLPETDHVASELRMLRGLMKQFAAKVEQTQLKSKDHSSEPSDVVDQTAEDSNIDTNTTKVDQKKVTHEPFLDYEDNEILIYLDRAVRQDHVQLYIQPTVRLPQRTGAFYECFSRITDDKGNVIRPEQYLPVSNAAGLTAALDNLLLFRCIQLVRQSRRDKPDIAFFCNISESTLTDVDFFTDFIDFMAENIQLAQSLVFEFTQATIENTSFEVQTNLKRLAQLGFRLSVDKLENLDFDLTSLSSRGFKYIKIDAHLLHEIARGDTAPVNMKSLKGAMDREAMDLIVEKIESEEMLRDLLDLNIDFGQGYLFGEPRPAQN
ncbi:MAG: hypothetical protein CMM58_11635 [Rhodospirillaceae bacterium]|nr:hypothetical protein [Rhodospirillaceae bacterium]